MDIVDRGVRLLHNCLKYSHFGEKKYQRDILHDVTLFSIIPSLNIYFLLRRQTLFSEFYLSRRYIIIHNRVDNEDDTLFPFI